MDYGRDSGDGDDGGDYDADDGVVVMTMPHSHADINCADTWTASCGRSKFCEAKLMKYTNKSKYAPMEGTKAGLKDQSSRVWP